MYFCALGKFFLFSSMNSIRSTNVALVHNVLRIYEVRLNEILNYKQTLVGVSCIYAVISSFYLWKQFIFNHQE